MSGDVERVARAIYACDPLNVPWERATEYSRQQAVGQATAARRETRLIDAEALRQLASEVSSYLGEDGEAQGIERAAMFLTTRAGEQP